MLKVLLTLAISCLLVGQSLQDSFGQSCVNAHNRYRRLHKSTPNLVYDEEIAKYAQQWANKLANEYDFRHRPNNKYGENLFSIWGNADFSDLCTVAVESWYNEVKMYSYNNPRFSSDTGHFTQVVWKSTRRVGCGIAKKGNSAVVVCNYDPFGNLMGAFEENVMRKK